MPVKLSADISMTNLREFFRKPSGQRLLAFLAVLVPLLVLYWRALLGLSVFLYRDMNMVYLPVRTHFARRILAGEFPQWYPFDGLGSSYVGNVITGVFHPTVLLHLVFPDPLALNLTVILAHAMAAWGAYRLLRTWRCGRLAATAGGVAYCLSGYLVSMDGNVPYLLSAASMPWAMFGLEIANGGRKWGVAVCAAAMSSIATAVDAQGLYFMSLVLLALTVMRPVGGWPKAFARLAVAGGIAVILAGAQLVPTLFSPAIYSGEIGGSERQRVWFVHPLRLLDCIVPGPVLLSGRNVPRLLYGIPESMNSYWADLLYVGPSALALGIVALLGGKSPRPSHARFLGILCALALVIVLGTPSGTPGFSLAQKILPLWRGLKFRYPEKSFVFVSLSLSLLAGLGMQRLRTEKPARKRWLLLMGGLCAIIAAFAAFLEAGTLASAFQRGGENSPEILKELSEFQMGALPCALEGLFIAVPLTLLCVPLCFWNGDGLAQRAVALSSVLIPLVISTLPVARQYAVPAGLLERAPPALESIRRHVGGGVYGRIRSLGAMETGHRPFPRPYDGVESAHANTRYDFLRLRVGTQAAYGLEGGVGYLQQVTDGKTAMAYHKLPLDFFLRAFNVGAAVTYVGPEPPELPRDIEETYDAIFDDGVGARIRLAEPVPVSGTEEAVALAESGKVDPVAQVFVERRVKEDASELPAFPGGRPVNPSVEVVEYAPERIVVDASSDESCALFVADGFAEGWTATIDGVPVDIYPGDLSGRAVPFPAGRHRMEMTYRVPGQRAGLVLSALGILALAAFIALERRGHRRRHSNESFAPERERISRT